MSYLWFGLLLITNGLWGVYYIGNRERKNGGRVVPEWRRGEIPVPDNLDIEVTGDSEDE